MQFEVELKTDAGGDAKTYLLEALPDHPALVPYDVVVDSEHACMIEFGTGPASASPKYNKKKGEISPVRQAIRDWAAKKFGASMKADVNQIGDRIYRNIMEYGMLPYPYMRPAMHMVLEELDKEEWLENGMSIEDIADAIAEEMKNILVENDTLYTGELYDSIRLRRNVTGDFDTEDEGDNTRISEEVWASDRLAFDGVRQARQGFERGRG